MGSIGRVSFVSTYLEGCYSGHVFEDLPDARDGLTRKERVVLFVLRRAEADRKGRGVRAAMLYGRALEHVDMSIGEFMQIVERLSCTPHPLMDP